MYSFFIDDVEQTWISYNQESDQIVYDINDDVVKQFATQDENTPLTVDMIIEAGEQVVAATLQTTVTIRNPCFKGTESVNYLPEFMEMEKIIVGVGESREISFSDAGDSVGTRLEDLHFCGTRSFKVLA